MPKCVGLDMEIWASVKVHTSCTPLFPLEFAVIISFTLRVVLGLIQSFRNHSFTQVMEFTQSDFFFSLKRRGVVVVVAFV